MITKKSFSLYRVYILKYSLTAICCLFIFINGISQVGTVPINTPTGGFRIDGYLQRQGVAGDWLSAPGLNQAGSFVLDNSGFPVIASSFDEYFDLWNDGNDDVFLSGRFVDNPNSMKWTLKKSQPKNDIGHCFIYLKRDAANHIWLVVAGDRFKSSGDTYLDIELFQNTVTKNSNGGFLSTGPHGGRTIGDIVITVGFDNSANTFDNLGKLQVSQWQPGSEAGDFSYYSLGLPAGVAYRASNPVSINAPFGAFGSTIYLPGTFAEVGIDLTLIIGGGGPAEEDACGNILGDIFKSVWIKSKSSLALNANLIDFIEPFRLPTNFSASVVANYSYFDLNRAQLSASVGPGSPDDYTIIWSPGGAIINGVVNTSITGSLTDIHSYNPVFTGDAGFPCASYIWNIGLIRKSDNCLVGRGRIILRPPCDRIGKPINPDRNRVDRNGIREDIVFNEEIKIYPNPNKGSATIILPHDGGYKNVDLINMTGVLVHRWSNVTSNFIQFKNLTTGIYLLKVVADNGKVITRKIIVNQ